MSEPVKETVIIVHGTWAGAAAGKARWYQAANGAPVDFIAKLNAALERRGSAARCWAHCAQESQIFHWSGENSWTARTQAASALADYVVKLRNDGWRCHIVAHSHGGNVMVEALPQLMAAPDSNNLHGRLVTLGTPFIDTMSPILRRSERGAKVLRVVSWIIFAILILMLLSLLSYFGLANVGVYFFGILIFLFLIGIFFRIKRRTDHRDYWPIIDAPDHTQPQLLAIGSPMDEPWQVLHHMRIADNPLAVRSNFLSYILSSLRSIVIQRGTVARIHGARSYRDLGWLAKLIMAFLYLSLGFLLFGLLILPDQESASRAGRTAARADEAWLGIVATTTFLFCVLVVFTQLFGREFFSAFFAPFRWCVRLVGSVVNVFPAVMTYGVRYLGWSVLLKIAMGLEGYRFTLPLVEQFPHNVPENFGKYEDMPKQAQQCAMDKRSAWIARHLGDVSQTFGKMAITATDINSLLRAIEEDQSLVHAAYYTDEECIARIADWIAGTG